MNRLAISLAGLCLAHTPWAYAQDAMQYGVKHLRVLAENDKARVLKYTPERGNKTPLHSHPASVLYIIRGGRIRVTMADGSTVEAELKSGDALLRGPVTHSDEALDDLEVVLIELKNQP